MEEQGEIPEADTDKELVAQCGVLKDFVALIIHVWIRGEIESFKREHKNQISTVLRGREEAFAEQFGPVLMPILEHEFDSVFAEIALEARDKKKKGKKDDQPK